MARYFPAVVEAAFDRLLDELDSTAHSLVEMDVVMEALEGDASHLPQLASDTADRVIVGAPLSALDRFFIANVLRRIAMDEATARAIAGKIGRGAPKRGARSIAVAEDVLDHIVHDQESTTTSIAWEKVAARHHLSIDTVREYWALRKVSVCCTRFEEVWNDSDSDVDLDDAIAGILKAKREKQRLSSTEEE